MSELCQYLADNKEFQLETLVCYLGSSMAWSWLSFQPSSQNLLRQRFMYMWCIKEELPGKSSKGEGEKERRGRITARVYYLAGTALARHRGAPEYKFLWPSCYYQQRSRFSYSGRNQSWERGVERKGSEPKLSGTLLSLLAKHFSNLRSILQRSVWVLGAPPTVVATPIVRKGVSS